MPFALVFNRHRQVRVEESPAFAHVAERFRKAGDLQRAVSLCRDGLRRFPDHVSGRVTLGLALVDLGHHADARKALKHALKLAPDNLAAIRGMAHLHDHGDNDPGESLPMVEAATGYEPMLEQSDLARRDELARDLWRAPEPEPVIAPEPVRAAAPAPDMKPASELEPGLELAFASLEELDPVMPAPPLEELDPVLPAPPLEELDPVLPALTFEDLDPDVPAPQFAEQTAHLEQMDQLDFVEASDDDVDPAVRAYREALPIGCYAKDLDVMSIGLQMESRPPESLPPYDVHALERFLSQVQTRKLVNA